MATIKVLFLIYVILIINLSQVISVPKKAIRCPNGKAPLSGISCGRVINRQDCPANYVCVIAPNDAYSICCPVATTTTTSTTTTKIPFEKLGSCPPTSDVVGICIAQCSNDTNCEGNLKCCGNCPRQCVQPVF